MSKCDMPGLLPITEAKRLQNTLVSPITETETVTLDEALNRIVALDVVSPLNVPPADNSAMDGYALMASDAESDLAVIGEALAGHPFNSELTQGQAVRIMTGAPVPPGADAVIMQEEVQRSGDTIRCTDRVKPGQCIRKAGEDIATNSVVITKGARIAPPHLSLLASIGIQSIEVFRLLKVGIIATGDELIAPGKPLQSGQIYESNRAGLKAVLRNLGAEVIDYGIIADNLAETEKTFQQAAIECDWLLSSGGVSVGEADFVKEVLDRLGSVNFWKVAIKPGKPYAFGKIGTCLFSGLPGNPVSSFVTLHQLVLPSIRALAGEIYEENISLRALLQHPVRRRPGRTDFQRAILSRDNHGNLQVSAQGKQGSGVMSSFTLANCFMVIDADTGSLEAGSWVDVQPFDYLLKQQ